MYFELYDKPLRSKQIYGKTAPAHLDDLLFISDDYNGYCVALDPIKGWPSLRSTNLATAIDPTAWAMSRTCV